MRIIGGKYRGKKLQSPADSAVRPTLDRVRETLFNILQFRVPECRFLDLFAGSGAIGIEAYSRGAREVVFVEKQKEHVRLLRNNLASVRAECLVLQEDAILACKHLQGSFDLIYLDPPYEAGLYLSALRAVAENGRLAEEGTVVCERLTAQPPSYEVPWHCRDSRKIGTVTLDFLEQIK